jgi:CDP-4-dehydro-6-deoxyglucose reductase, E3
VKKVDGGVLSDYWFGEAKEGDLLRFEGPLGTFFLRDGGPANLLFLATGSGIAPIKALLEELAGAPERAAQHSILVYWGNRDAADFVWTPDNMALDLTFHRLLSGSDEGWRDRRGYIQDAAVEDGFDPTNTIVYACGSDAMITSARNRFAQLGLPHRRFFSDAFVSSS